MDQITFRENIVVMISSIVVIINLIIPNLIINNVNED